MTRHNDVRRELSFREAGAMEILLDELPAVIMTKKNKKCEWK